MLKTVLIKNNELLRKYRIALKIVTCRYTVNKVNREQRICTLSVLREIQDDFHFVIKCPAYSAISMFLFYSHHILVL